METGAVRSREIEVVPSEMNFEEEKTMVCIRENVEDLWKGIETEVNEAFKTKIHLRPCQADRAFFTCKDDEEFKDRNFVFLTKAHAIISRRWIDENGIPTWKITFTEGWLSISGLPVHLVQ